MADKFLDIVWRTELSYFKHGKTCDYQSILEILHFRRPDQSGYFAVRETPWTRSGPDETTILAECAERDQAIVWATDYLKKMVDDMVEKS
jgi:hypothetical protein